MLKKYRKSGTLLSLMQLKEIKGGTTGIQDALLPPQCTVNSDCGYPACTGPEDDTCWICSPIKKRCMWLN